MLTGKSVDMIVPGDTNRRSSSLMSKQKANQLTGTARAN